MADARLRRPRRADPPAQRRPHADAVQPAAGGRRRPERRSTIARAIRDLIAGVSATAMAIAITIPRLGWNMEEGVFVGWLKQRRRDRPRRRSAVHPRGREGDPGHRGDRRRDPPDRRRRPRPPATVVAVGTVIGYLLGPGESEPVDAVDADSSRPSADGEWRAAAANGDRTPAATDRRDGAIGRGARRWRAGWRASWASTGRGSSAAAARAGSARSTSSPPHGPGSSPRTRGPADRRDDPSRSGRPAGRSPRGWSRAGRRRRP